MFEAKAKLCYERKRCETKTQIIYSVRRQVGIEWILHGRLEHVSWLNLFGFRCVFILLTAAEGDGGSLQGSHLIFADHCYFLKPDYI